MAPFDLSEPRSLAEAVELLQAREGTVRPLAGGTALMLMMKAGVLRPTRLVNLRRLGFDHLEVDARGSLLARAGAVAGRA